MGWTTKPSTATANAPNIGRADRSAHRPVQPGRPGRVRYVFEIVFRPGRWALGVPDEGRDDCGERRRVQAGGDHVSWNRANGGPALTFADYAATVTGGFSTNKRMPATAANVARGIVYRKGRTGLRTACLPQWGSIAVDDIYSDAASGQATFYIERPGRLQGAGRATGGVRAGRVEGQLAGAPDGPGRDSESRLRGPDCR